MGQDLLQEGIAAFQAGDRAKARELFMLVAEIDSKNERAWYYLAVLEPDTALRRQYLERVLTINPKNEKAREVLDRLKAREPAVAEPVPTAFGAAPAPRPQASSEQPRSSRIRSLHAQDDAPGAVQGTGFALPFNIPGAPLRVSPQKVARDGIGLLRTGFQTFGRAAGVTLFTGELGKATWWRFWLLSVVVAVVVALLGFATSIVIVLRFPQAVSSIFKILLTPLLTIPIILGMEYAGVYASHRWAMTKNGGGSLVRHAYGVALRWLPLVVVYAAINFVLFLLGASVTVALFILMALIAVVQLASTMDKVRMFYDPQQKWFTAGIMFAGAVITGVIIAILIGSLIFTGTIPYMIG
ncbi:MAG: hypothetical protein IPK17_21030 [Chloroflexi bacterium]|uniref:tetratricopeptide repeat protein n=1 Tax=Candidatus Flexifilum breve TaxID=3140694 RepID=UPI00313468DB|nr:hypothetical protein [Chloroflexota bacterium]